MATPDEEKRQAMDAVSHGETTTQKKLFRRAGPAATLGCTVAASCNTPAVRSLAAGVKEQAMEVISGIETIKQIGLMKLTGGIAVYVAHIRQLDSEAMHEKKRTKEAAMRQKKRMKDPYQKWGPERLGRG